MIDRNKVIEGLEMCTNISQDGCLMLCPYKDEKDETYSGFCEQVLKQDVLALLKEQEWQTKRLTPTEPNVSINAYGVKFYYCPHCQRPILKSGIIGRPRHCEDCGQAVKW